MPPGTEPITTCRTGGHDVGSQGGRIFGFKPYSWAIKTFGNVARLRTFVVELKDGVIWLLE